ncbi:uncharacterized protein CDAR_430991 [Caerostris darwini]|uniref:TPM domain-containing protein n=1 Tax=Caerostris darwini TaxID=1538125 RepID=A0AAV4USZ4_9ARAC|nr:uncharacterized protein CDAR_430991 [Caerostris darwini]
MKDGAVRMGPWVLLPFLLCAHVVSGQTEFPNPQKEWRMCGMPRPAFVCDPDFILARGDAEKLDQIAAEFRKSTTAKCSDNAGISLGIFVKHNISKETTSKYEGGKALAEMIRRRWSLSRCDSDIVIVLLTQQNISDLSLGPAVASLLPDKTAARIMSDCRVHFESGWFYQGLESIANSLNDELVGLQRRGRPVFKNLVLGMGLGFGVLLILALAALFIVHRQNRTRKKSYCSDIYDGVPTKNNRRKTSFNREQHLERLKHLNSSDDENEDQYEDGQYSLRAQHPSMHFMRLQRQLSAVVEESPEDIKRFSSSSQKENIPVTEL